ncbi:MAG: Trp family transcriptional regulator [Patescibacteria group bacterium]|nr:Trp family transcriptional regulator [Patescibacteria group bacterium]
MTKISRYGLKGEQKEKFIKELWDLFASFEDAEAAKNFLAHYLTSAEVIIFAKRWQALKCLAKKQSYGEIGKKLKMSSTTLSRYSNRMRANNKFCDEVARRL